MFSRNTNNAFYKKKIWSVLFGLMISFNVYNLTKNEDLSFGLQKGEAGDFVPILKDFDASYDVVVSNLSATQLWIRYNAPLDWFVIAFSLVIGGNIALIIYRGNNAKPAELSYDERLVTEHPRYADFLSEDSDREFYVKDELVVLFSEWLSKQD